MSRHVRGFGQLIQRKRKKRSLFGSQCYMYCLWEQFGLVDDKRELSLNGMLTFFQRIPAYRAEVQKAISECKGIGKYLGIYILFVIFFVLTIDRVFLKLLFPVPSLIIGTFISQNHRLCEKTTLDQSYVYGIRLIGCCTVISVVNRSFF